MDSTLQIEKMSVADKIKTMELIWDDLCRTSELISSPDWHQSVLREREEKVAQGSGQFTDWSAAKEKIRTSVK